MPKIPRLAAVAEVHPHEYPRWLEEKCTQFDMARTLAVAGIPDAGLCGAVKAAFCKDFGDNSVVELLKSRALANFIYYLDWDTDVSELLPGGVLSPQQL